ncbi:MAG: FAD-binding oxidoreductase [Chloroflexota bacterium]|nr:FAD-binding oxidoreductase [Chloroflexota bacterium]
MARSAEVVVVGGGVVGASVAWHLAERGLRGVVVVDQGAFGGGTTAKGAGGVRSQFGDPAEVAFSRYSLDFYRRFAEQVGGDCGFTSCGFLVLLRDEAAVARYREMAAQGRAAGVDWRILRPEEVAALVPEINLDGVRAGSFTPHDGVASPPLAAQQMLQSAVARGVEARPNTAVTGFRFAGERLEAVETSRGPIAARWAVIAAGPWTAQVGQLAGLTLPVAPMRRHLFTTAPTPLLRNAPMTIDHASGWYFRVEADHLLVSAGEMTPAPEFDVALRPEVAERARAGLKQLLPRLGEIPFTAARAGLREMTPDEKALIGRAPDREGLLVAAGFSGHGFMHAPAAGRAIADVILQGATSFDLTPFDPGRFVENN